MKDTLREVFKVEAGERLAELETCLLDLEKTPDDKNTVEQVFRALHTIKGSGAMVGWDEIARFTHELENLFELVRQNKVHISKDLIDLTLAAGDVIRCMLEEAEPEKVGQQAEEIVGKLSGLYSQSEPAGEQSTEPSPEADSDRVEVPCSMPGEYTTYRIFFRPYPEVLGRGTNPILLLNELRGLGECMVVAKLDAIPTLEEIKAEDCYTSWDAILTTCEEINAIRDIFIFVEDECELKIEVVDTYSAMDEGLQPKKLGELLVERGDVAPEQVEEVLGRRKRIGEMLVDAGLVSPDKVEVAVAEQQHIRKILQKELTSTSASTIRVPAAKLDSLVDLVGELVTVQASLNQLAMSDKKVLELRSIAEHVSRLTAELRDNTMSLRMLPIGTIFNKFNRLVRDLSAELGKEVKITADGTETELDKTVIEHLNDPLVHLIRNSIDHGIEPPDVRKAAGKSSEGKLHLSAAHSGAHVLIRITDDGAGMDTKAIRAKAEAAGLIASDAELSEKEIFALIFASGLSTARKVTSVSGRGVGMDVVKRSIEALRGSIEVESERGVGTTITLKLPLTLAIIDGLLVRVGNASFVLPLTVVEECVELSAEDVARAHSRQVAFIRGKIVPYIRLRDRFSINGTVPPIEQVVVTETIGGKVGFVVDKVIGEHQTVIKNLGKIYRNVEGISGATILGDGTVALILDVSKLTEAAERLEVDQR